MSAVSECQCDTTACTIENVRAPMERITYWDHNLYIHYLVTVFISEYQTDWEKCTPLVLMALLGSSSRQYKTYTSEIDPAWSPKRREEITTGAHIYIAH